MKIVVKIFTLVVVAVLIIALIPGLDGTKSRILDFLANDNHIISLSFKDEFLQIKIRDKEKESVKKFAKKIKGFIFREATEHNPPGDMVPDAIDDNVMDSLKKHFN